MVCLAGWLPGNKYFIAVALNCSTDLHYRQALETDMTLQEHLCPCISFLTSLNLPSSLAVVLKKTKKIIRVEPGKTSAENYILYEQINFGGGTTQ